MGCSFKVSIFFYEEDAIHEYLRLEGGLSVAFFYLRNSIHMTRWRNR